MKVASILKGKGSAVVTTPPRTSVATAARLLRDGLAGRGATLLELPVSFLMTRAPISCTPDDDILSVMRQMTRLRVRHLPVVVGERLQRIVSIGDVVKHRLDEMETEANVLREAFLARQ
jgi:signal-transduction protein with cAMP-binding, CBS, and nucleotidyltransferase domain